LVFLEKTDLEVRASATTSASVSANFNILLVQNGYQI
jgi:hypothetical protein